MEVDKSGASWQLSNTEIFPGRTSVPAIPGRVAYRVVSIGHTHPYRRELGECIGETMVAWIQLKWHSYLNRGDTGIYTHRRERQNCNEFNKCDIRSYCSEHPQGRKEILTNDNTEEVVLSVARRFVCQTH